MRLDEQLAKEERQQWEQSQKKIETPIIQKTVDEYRSEILSGSITIENETYETFKKVSVQGIPFWQIKNLVVDEVDTEQILSFRYEKLDMAVNIMQFVEAIKIKNLQEYKSGIRSELLKSQMNITWMEEEGKLKSGKTTVYYCTGAIFTAGGYIMEMFFYCKHGKHNLTGTFSCPYSKKDLLVNLLKANITLMFEEE